MQAPRRSKREHHPTARLVAASTPPPAPSSSRPRHTRKRVPSPSPPPAEPAHRRRMRAAAHTTTTSLVARVYLGEGPRGKLLDRYTSHECTLLCEVIMAQLKTQALAPTALDAEQSPACIQWEAVAKRMRTTHKLRVTARECQQLWKFLAYGQVTGPQDDEELLPHSDDEDVSCSPAEINAKLAKKPAAPKAAPKVEKLAPTEGEEKETVVSDKADACTDKRAAKEEAGETEKKADGASKEEASQPAEEKAIAAELQAQAEEKEAGTTPEPAKSDAQPGEKAADPAKSTQANETESSGSSVQLYPTYTLPMGAPDAWHRPFNPKKSLPLTFVASRFLKRKPLPAQTHAAATKAAQHVLPGSTATGAVAVGVAVKPSTAEVKRKLVASAASAAEAKKRKMEIGTRTPSPSTFSSSRVFTPSSTPPPPAKRPRTQLEFFEIRLRAEMEKAQDKTVLTAAEIQHRFGQASVQVRRECQELAVHDIDRYNRELVRVRIWEKAVGSKIVKPAASPSTNSASVAAPAASRSTGPSAALVAHAAAVSAAGNKTPAQPVVDKDKTVQTPQAKSSVAAPPSASTQTQAAQPSNT